MVTYTTDNFVTAVKRVAHIPVGNSTFTAADLLAIGDTEMRTRVAPKVASCRENYWLTTQDQAVDSDGNEYPLPSKALGSAIVDVMVRSGENLIHLSRIEASDLYSTQYSVRPAYCYYIEDATLKLIPNNISGTVVMWYYRIPSQLTAVENCAQITAIASNTVTVSSVPSTFSVLPEMDIVSQQPGFNVLKKDSSPVSVVSSDILFDEIPETVAVGDYVCLSGQSCVVQCPLEWIECLVQATAVKIYEIQGYEKKHDGALKTLMEMENMAMSLVSPRTIESSKIISGGGSLLCPQTIGWKLPVRG